MQLWHGVRFHMKITMANWEIAIYPEIVIELVTVTGKFAGKDYVFTVDDNDSLDLRNLLRKMQDKIDDLEIHVRALELVKKDG